MNLFDGKVMHEQNLVHTIQSIALEDNWCEIVLISITE